MTRVEPIGRALLVSTLLVAILAVPCVAWELKAPAVEDGLALLPAGSVQWTGPIGEAIQTSIDGRIRNADLSMLLSPFQSRPEAGLWQCEFWGKWFTSAALAYRYQPTPELRTVLDRAVEGLLATQTPDGYIGTYKRSAELTGWDVWGRKYVLLGLLAYYDLTGDRKALDAACSRGRLHASARSGPARPTSSSRAGGTDWRPAASSNRWFCSIAGRAKSGISILPNTSSPAGASRAVPT